MAAAALEHAARRLGGGGALRQAAVSRLSPAVEQLGQRRGLPRFAHTKAHHPPTTATTSSDSKGVLMKRIDKSKEELYDLMTEAHDKYGTGRDKKLFKRLSGHNEPRPSDPTWRSNQNLKRIDQILYSTFLDNPSNSSYVLHLLILKMKSYPRMST
ncbi:hypothetical protein ACQ4PT_037250 [Festuca glaucescens]